MKRQNTSCARLVAVAANAVATASSTADVTMMRRSPMRSASLPTAGAASATAMTGAVIVNPT